MSSCSEVNDFIMKLQQCLHTFYTLFFFCFLCLHGTRSARKSISLSSMTPLICTRISNRAGERNAGGCVWHFVKGRAYRRWDHEGNDCIHPHCTTVLPFRWPACTPKRAHCQVGYPCARVLARQNSGLCPRERLLEGMRCGSIYVCCTEL